MQIDQATECDNFMSAWEAKEYGLVDAVIDDGKPGLVAPPVDANAPPMPKLLGLCQAIEARTVAKDLPSEHTLFRKANVGGQSDDSDRGTQQEKQNPASV